MTEIGMRSIMFLGAKLFLSNIILLNTGVYI